MDDKSIVQCGEALCAIGAGAAEKMPFSFCNVDAGGAFAACGAFGSMHVSASTSW